MMNRNDYSLKTPQSSAIRPSELPEPKPTSEDLSTLVCGQLEPLRNFRTVIIGPVIR